MLIEHQYYQLKINGRTGSLQSYTSGNKQFIHNGESDRPLFTIRFRDADGAPTDLNALDASVCTVESKQNSDITNVNMDFRKIGGLPIHVQVTIACPQDQPLTFWNLSIDNGTDLTVEWIDYPNIVVPNDLIATGGKGRVVWPAMEGVLVEDADMREGSWLRYQEPGYPTKGWAGIYPGPCPTQFMAYYDDQAGMYMGAHDHQGDVKGIEFYKLEDGIRLEFRIFPGAVGRGQYTMPYPMVLGVFQGDWHEAAAIYRSWYLTSGVRKPPKVYDNEKLPDWIKESPVVVSYPMRGTKDTGNMDPNEYYPHANIIPHLDKLSEQFDSKIMALLMHWEGSAPWSPPYAWPPFGGAEDFTKFVDLLHEHEHLLGMYSSGIGWTNESALVPEYTRKQQFEDEGLAAVMCESPEGELPYSLICQGAIRWGYDMCPTHPFTHKTVLSEIAPLIESGCDYVQYFDQNLGGLSSFCYSKKHGHPHAPGNWQPQAMTELFKEIQELIEASGRKMLFGCEAGAAEPFIPDLPFNEMRYFINYSVGNPIPIYQYIYHEYCANFMGNNNTCAGSLDYARSPDNFLWRIAYSFHAGDMLTVVLKGGGEIHWDWGSEWSLPGPNQEDIKLLIRTINEWRKEIGMPFLLYGQMHKPLPVECEESEYIHLQNGKKFTNPPVLTSRWSDREGREAQLFINYTKRVQDITVMLGDQYLHKTVTIIKSADGSDSEQRILVERKLALRIKPLSVIMIRL